MLVIKKAAMPSCSSGRMSLKLIPISLMLLCIIFISFDTSGQVKKTAIKNLASNLVTDTTPKMQTINTAVLTGQQHQPQTETPKTIDKNILYHNFQKTDTTVKYHVIKNGAVVGTETAKVNEIKLNAGEKLVLPQGKEITRANQATLNQLKSVSPIQFSRAELKMLPELTVESKDSGSRQISYQLYFFPYEPFTYNDSLRKFQSRIGFFFLRSDSLSAVNPIDPVNIIVTSDDLKQINPRPLQINHLNFPASDVDLAGENVSDSVEIRVITASKPDGYQTFLKIKPVLEITTNRVSLQGYGVQKVPLEVRLIGSNSADSITVSLSASKGTVTPASVMLKYNSPQTVYLTSEGTGQILISAKSSSLASNDLHLSYSFPWYFLIASILGGLLGGFAKYYSGRKKKFSMWPIIGGVFAGLVGAMAYYALGITLLNFRLSAEMNEFAVLALSALFAYFGIPRNRANKG